MFMPLLSTMLGIAAAATPQAPLQATPTAAPRIAATFIIADAYGQRGGRRFEVLAESTAALLVTLHDLGTITLHDSSQANNDFDSCFGSRRVDAWENAVAGCIGRRLKPRSDGVVPFVILVNDTRSRSSAQQLTCVGPGRAIGSAKAHLADLFHPRSDIRAWVRSKALACIGQALPAPR